MSKDIPTVSLDLPYINAEPIEPREYEKVEFGGKRELWEFLPTDVKSLCNDLAEEFGKLGGVDYYRAKK